MLCLFITDLTARYHLDTLPRLFCIFETPSWLMWQDTDYNGSGGWGYLNALFYCRGGWEVLTQWKAVILYLHRPYSYSTLHTYHIKPLQYKSLWMLNLFSLGLDSWQAADLGRRFIKIEQQAQTNQIMICWFEWSAQMWLCLAMCESSNERITKYWNKRSHFLV